MIKHIWSVLCRSSALDKDSNVLSLFDVLEQIKLLEPLSEPGQVPISMHLVTLWARENMGEPTTGRARVSLLAPGDENPVGTPVEYQVDLTTFRRLRNRVTFSSFPIVRAGVYEFVVEVNRNGGWVEAARVPLELVVEAPTGQQ